MADPSPSATLRQLAEAATSGEWKVDPPLTKMVLFPSGADRAAEIRAMPTEADARLIALAPALAVGLADVADEIETRFGSQTWAQELLARLGDLVGQEPTA